MKKILYKVVATILALGLTCTNIMASAAMCPLQKRNGVILVNDSGNVLEFSFIESDSGDYLMDYYFDGILITSYLLTPSGATIVHGDSVGNEIDYVSTVRESGREGQYSSSNSIRNLGVFHYNDVDLYTLPHIMIESELVNSKETTHRVTAPSEARVADIIADIAGFLLGFFGGDLILAEITVLANTIFSEMLSSSGGKVSGEVITNGISDFFSAIELDYRLKATFGASNTDACFFQYYYGKGKYVTYQQEKVTKYVDVSGYTPNNWATYDFGYIVWKKLSNYILEERVRGYETSQIIPRNM